MMEAIRKADNSNLYSQQWKGGKKDINSQHKHLFAVGIDQAIDGNISNSWCYYCKKNVPFSSDQSASIEGPLTWLKVAASMQDYDMRGFRRRLMVGTFQPQVIEDWWAGAYV